MCKLHSYKTLWLPLMMALIAVIFSGGCRKAKFSLEFSLPADTHTAYTLSYYISSPKQSKWMESGVVLQNGKAHIELPVYDPTVLTLKAGQPEIYIYVEKGEDIKISGDEADIFSWTIEGNDINKEWSAWRKANKGIFFPYDAEKVNAAVEKYVKKNPEKPLSALLLLYDFDRRENNAGFLRLWKTLKGEAAKEKWITLSGRTDIYTNHPVEEPDQKKSRRIILKSFGNGADTIVTGKVPVTILFWRNSDNLRSEMIDSLKRLREEHPDSDKYIIADICFDPDSLSWVAPLGRDSLKKTIRAWNPVAEADSTMRALGVERTPFIITFNPIKGK